MTPLTPEDRPALRIIFRYGEIRALLENPRVPGVKPVRQFGVTPRGERVPIANTQWERGGSGPVNRPPDPKALDLYLRLRSRFDRAGETVWPAHRFRNAHGYPIMGSSVVDTWLDFYQIGLEGPWTRLASLIGRQHHEQARRDFAKLLDILEGARK